LGHLLVPGVRVRIGDEDLTIDEVDGDKAWFTPYHTHGITAGNVFIEETLIGTGELHSNLQNVTITPQHTSADASGITSELVTTDAYMLADETVTEIFASASSVSDTVLRTPTVCATLTGGSKVAIYKMKSRIVPVDATALEMKAAFESMDAIGTVEVERYGPRTDLGYTWSVTYTSAFGSTRTCTGLTDSDSDCLKPFVATTSSLTLGGNCANSAFSGEEFVADGYYNGRKKYIGPLYDTGILGPYTIQYSTTTFKFGLYLETVYGLQLVAGYEEFSNNTKVWPVDGFDTTAAANCKPTIGTSAAKTLTYGTSVAFLCGPW